MFEATWEIIKLVPAIGILLIAGLLFTYGGTIFIIAFFRHLITGWTTNGKETGN